MATQNSANQDYVNNSDGFSLGGGTTERKLVLTGANVTLTGAGTNTYTFPSATDTLVGRASTDILTNKTLTNPVVDQFGTASGLGAAYSTYAPTYTNVTQGTGPTSVAHYLQIGKHVHCWGVFTFGTSGAVTGLITISLPVASVASYTTANTIGTCDLFQTGVASYMGNAIWATTTTFQLFVENAAGTYITDAVTSSTAPFTWAATHKFAWNIVYEAA